MTDHIFTITELSEYVKTLLPNKKIKVMGEVSQPKISGGHLYFSLKDNNMNMKSIIWKSNKTDKNLEHGQKITIECRLDYYGLGGTINLIVDKISEINNNKGELHIKYEKLKQEFIEKGYFNNNIKLSLPNIIKNICIITSSNGAALQDFLYNLGNNNMDINYNIIDVMVQGNDCPKNICNILDNLNESYDMIVITRGGGSFEDLFGFSQPELIESIYNFRINNMIPTLSAIGHMVDNPLSDLAADISTPTPSLAAQYIVDHNRKHLSNIQCIKNDNKNKLLQILNNNMNMLIKANNKLEKIFNMFHDIKNKCKQQIKDELNNNLLQLTAYMKMIEVPKETITLFNKKRKVESADEIHFNDILRLRWGDMEFTIKILT